MIEQLFKLLQENPKFGAAVIAVVSASLSWLLRNIAQLIIDNYRYNKDLKTFFWKEKINAAKKATEFYYEHLNFLNLVRIQFELYEAGTIEHQAFIESIERDVNFYKEKLKSFPHFEYHHINIFYDFDETKTMEIGNKSIKIQQEIQEIIYNPNISTEEFHEQLKSCSRRLKENYSELFLINKEYVKQVRKDINKFI